MVSGKKYGIRHIVKKGAISADSFRQEEAGQGYVDFHRVQQRIRESS